MNINEKILLLRKKGLSQESLADKLNITRQTVSNWELGQTTPDILQKWKAMKNVGMTGLIVIMKMPKTIKKQ